MSTFTYSYLQGGLTPFPLHGIKEFVRYSWSGIWTPIRMSQFLTIAPSLVLKSRAYASNLE